MPDQPKMMYGSAVRSFDLSQFAHEDWFPLLQVALNDAAHGLPDSVGLAQWLRLVHDVAVTLPYSDQGDCCRAAGDYAKLDVAVPRGPQRHGLAHMPLPVLEARENLDLRVRRQLPGFVVISVLKTGQKRGFQVDHGTPRGHYFVDLGTPDNSDSVQKSVRSECPLVSTAGQSGVRECPMIIQTLASALVQGGRKTPLGERVSGSRTP